MQPRYLSWAAALAVPIFYLIAYTPYGMDTTDFGYFYGYAWRIIKGQIPYRDFFYIKPAFPLYWHAFWLALTPFKWQILAGKAGFCLSLLASSWLTALFLNRIFKISRAMLPLLATCGFVFGVHTFPHMPWHTADGLLFSAAALYLSLPHPALAGVCCALALLCKQSFLLLPFAIIFMLYFCRRTNILHFCAGCALILVLWLLWLIGNNAWQSFLDMTTGQLDIREALDAGILIYLRQNWLIPALALLPLLVSWLLKRKLPWPLKPAFCYLALLAAWYIYNVYSQQRWLGFGASWPTLWLLIGCTEALFSSSMLTPLLRHKQSAPALTAASFLICSLLPAWSAAISGGYKIPAMFATPLIFAFISMHTHFFGHGLRLAWAVLITGLLIFWAGYQYPYIFPERPISRQQMIFDAGSVYTQASGVKIDRDMLERLAELKYLRGKYGPDYKTLPGFSFAYYLNNDEPVIGSDWLIDWEINGKTDELYNQLMDKNVTVFMERDQMHIQKADNYDRAGYSVPQKVVRNWRKVEETSHFVVMQKP